MVAARGGGCVIAVAPEVGGEAAAGLTFSLTLFAALSWAVSWGLLLGWSHTFGPMLEGIANAVKIDAWKIHLDPAGKLRDIDHAVRNALDVSIAASDTAMGYWWHQTARLQGWIVDETWKLARDTYGFGQWMVHTFVPTYVHGLTDVLHGATRTVVKTVTRVERVVVQVPRVAHAAAHAATAPLYRTVAVPHLGELQWIHRHWKALTAVLATAGSIALAPGLVLPRLWHGIDELKARLGRTERRLTKVEGLFGATALALAMANVLGIPNPRCLRRGPIGKVARRLCGMSSGALNDILGLLVDVLIVSDICEVITLLNQGLTVIEGPLADLTGVVGSALCHGDYSEPPSLPALTLYLPPSPSLALAGV